MRRPLPLSFYSPDIPTAAVAIRRAGCHPAPHGGKPQTVLASHLGGHKVDYQSAAGYQAAPQNRRGARGRKLIVVHCWNAAIITLILPLLASAQKSQVQ